MLLARSALATQVDPLRTFTVPEPVRANVAPGPALDPGLPAPGRAAADRGRGEPGAAALGAVRGPGLSRPRPDPGVARRAPRPWPGAEVPDHLIQQMNTYFARHTRDRVSPAEWLSWGGDSGRVVGGQGGQRRRQRQRHRQLDPRRRGRDRLRHAPAAAARLLGAQRPAHRRVRRQRVLQLRRLEELGPLPLLPCADLPRAGRRRRTGLGPAHHPPGRGRGAAGRRLRRRRRRGRRGGGARGRGASTATPRTCSRRSWRTRTSASYCALDEMDERHQADAVDYTQADTTPEDAHYFSETVNDAEKCEICGKATEDTLHKQAALASYYLYKTTSTRRSPRPSSTGRARPPRASRSRAAGHLGGPDLRRGLGRGRRRRPVRARDRPSTTSWTPLFWERRGQRGRGPADLLRGLHRRRLDDGRPDLRLRRRDVLRLRPGAQDLGADPAGHARADLRARRRDAPARSSGRWRSIPDEPVDLREVDPGEALMMQDAVPCLDDGMNDRVVDRHRLRRDLRLAFAERRLHPRGARGQRQEAGPRRRAAGSPRRAAGSRSARTARPGVVTEDQPGRPRRSRSPTTTARRSGSDAKSTRVLARAGTRQPDAGERQPLDTSKIEGKPRATASTPKALLPSMLPPMDRDALNAVVENYPNFIEKERAGAAARQAAQDAQDDASRAAVRGRGAEGRGRVPASAGGDPRQGQDDPRLDRQDLPQASLPEAVGSRSPERDQLGGQPRRRPAGRRDSRSPTRPSPTSRRSTWPRSTRPTSRPCWSCWPWSRPAPRAPTPQVLRYTATGWVNDPKILRQLRSSSPPAIVALDEAAVQRHPRPGQGRSTPRRRARPRPRPRPSRPQSQVAAVLAVWGEYGELIAAGVPGIADTPSDIAASRAAQAVLDHRRRWHGQDPLEHPWRLDPLQPQPEEVHAPARPVRGLLRQAAPRDDRRLARRPAATSGAAGPRPSRRLLDIKLLTSDEVIAYSALVAAANALCAGVEAPDDRRGGPDRAVRRAVPDPDPGPGRGEVRRRAALRPAVADHPRPAAAADVADPDRRGPRRRR